jgi:hypothetical protein
MSTAPPVYDMSLIYDCTIPERLVKKVSTLKYFLKSCLELMKDETTLNALHNMIDQCTQDREVPNHIESSEPSIAQEEDKQRIHTECTDRGV